MANKLVLITSGGVSPAKLHVKNNDTIQFHSNETDGCTLSFTAGSPLFGGATTVPVASCTPGAIWVISGTVNQSYPYTMSVKGAAPALADDGPVIIVDPGN